MKIEIRNMRSSPVDPHADEIAAILAAIALKCATGADDAAAAQPVPISRWRTAGRTYDG